VLLISLICHTPIVIRGYPFALWWNIPQKMGVGMSHWYYWSNCLPERLVAFRKAMNLPHQAMCADSTSARPQPSKQPAKWVHFILMSCLLLSWWRPGQYQASSCLMVASNGSRCSPGHAALGYVLHIALMHLRGHQNGQWWRYICSSFSPFLFD
jgi:hypothetical protein